MRIGTLKLTFDVPWANSLKDKRMVVKSITGKLRDKFGVSVAEIEEQDTHRTAVLGVACVGGCTAQIDSVLDHMLGWIDVNSQAPLRKVEREVI
ncbi:MAG: DUF503 domain-containing protein [Oscillospiraceae bacterium]|nr:DUF503 domain-containing protein [Oscillospiraceae bacterium]